MGHEHKHTGSTAERRWGKPSSQHSLPPFPREHLANKAMCRVPGDGGLSSLGLQLMTDLYMEGWLMDLFLTALVARWFLDKTAQPQPRV